MRSPGDRLPLERVLANQVRAVSGQGLPIDVFVLRNWPPWTRAKAGADSQQTSSEHFNASKLPKGTTVREVDYSGLHSVGFLRQYFGVHRYGEPWNATVGELLKRATDGFGTSGKQIASNFVGLISFMQLCKEAGEATGLCIYLDPDIFVYRGDWGLADLAPGIFARHPAYMGLQPPSICDGHELALVDRGGVQCRASPTIWWSSRFMVFNRTRLLQELPIRVEASRFNHFFETVVNGAIRQKTGTMRCGAETFAIHPPSRHLRQLLKGLTNASLGAVFNHTAVTSDEGVQAMLDRLEAGSFELPSKRRARDAPPSTDGASGCKEPLATNLCFDMLPSEKRISAGLAW